MSDEPLRILYPTFELMGDPCPKEGCRGVLVQTIRYRPPLDCWRECSQCRHQVERRPTSEMLQEAAETIGTALGEDD